MTHAIAPGFRQNCIELETVNFAIRHRGSSKSDPLTKLAAYGSLKLGVTAHLGWHTFRHTNSSLLRANRVDIKVMQELLRHAASRVTLDTYTQAVTAQKREAQSKVVQLLRGPTAVGA
ncbi:MAG: tyrosine-type recombinase/integrase [Terriglobia bacterium]